MALEITLIACIVVNPEVEPKGHSGHRNSMRLDHDEFKSRDQPSCRAQGRLDVRIVMMLKNNFTVDQYDEIQP